MHFCANFFVQDGHDFACGAVSDSPTLMRFLRARDYDITRAVTMYTDHVKWRKEQHVDTVLEDFEFTEREQYLHVYPQGYYNIDRVGRPVTIQHLGQVQPKRINQITTEDRMVRYHVQEYERFLKKIAPICSRLAGRHIDQTTAILDVKGEADACMRNCSMPCCLLSGSPLRLL
jgi:hypothetical protein